MNLNFRYYSKKRSFIVALFVIILLNACQKEEEPQISQDNKSDLVNGQIIEGNYIVVFKEGAIDLGSLRTSNDHVARSRFMREAAGNLLQFHRISSERMEQVYSSALHGFSARLDQDMLNQLRHDERVAYIEPDRIITLGPPAGKGPGGGGSTTDDEIPYGIKRVGGAGDGTGKTAFVIDTGIDLTHPDLTVANYGFNAFSSGRDGGSLNDGNGHGTHVAGTIAAKKDGKGVIGVAAGATVVPVKVLDSRGSGSYSGVIAGVDYVGTTGKTGDVANMSLGGPVSQALDDAVTKAASKGIKFVIAAGNSSDDSNYYSPARVNGSNIYTISAMDINDRWASFSNFKNPPVDYCAPGVSIKSTWKGGGYNTISGTSMAAPHAAGVLLLGNARTSGSVKNDPDGSPDPIISR